MARANYDFQTGTPFSLWLVLGGSHVFLRTTIFLVLRQAFKNQPGSGKKI
jgi:hypothetical protein